MTTPKLEGRSAIDLTFTENLHDFVRMAQSDPVIGLLLAELLYRHQDVDQLLHNP